MTEGGDLELRRRGRLLGIYYGRDPIALCDIFQVALSIIGAILVILLVMAALGSGLLIATFMMINLCL